MAQWSGGSWHLVRVRVRVRVRVSNQWADRAEAAGTGAATIRTHRLPAAAAPRARRWSSSPLASASHRPCRCRARAWLSMCVLPGRHVHAMCMASAQQTCGMSMPQRYHLQMPYACRIHGCVHACYGATTTCRRRSAGTLTLPLTLTPALTDHLQMPYASLESRVEVNAGGRSENVYDGALVVGSHSPSA